MPKNVSLLESLIENDSINLNLSASSWEEAVGLAIKPLVVSKAVEPKYLDAIIKSTLEFGPYYILSERLAMPHARPEDGVNKNSFSLITLKTPILFKGDDRKIDMLIALAATSADIHVGQALPQIIEVFGDNNIVKYISQAKDKKEVIEIITKQIGGK